MTTSERMRAYHCLRRQYIEAPLSLFSKKWNKKLLKHKQEISTVRNGFRIVDYLTNEIFVEFFFIAVRFLIKYLDFIFIFI